MEPKCLPHVTLKPNDYIPCTSHQFPCQSMEQQRRMENRGQHKEQPPEIPAGMEAPMAPDLAMFPGPCCTNKSRVPLLAPGNFLDRQSIDCRPPVGHPFVQHGQDCCTRKSCSTSTPTGEGLGWGGIRPQLSPKPPYSCLCSVPLPALDAGDRTQETMNLHPQRSPHQHQGTPQATQLSPEVLCTPKPTPHRCCSTRCWAGCWRGPPAGTGAAGLTPRPGGEHGAGLGARPLGVSQPETAG